MSALPQQPRDIGDILSASIKLYAESFTKWIGYGLIAFFIGRFNNITFMPYDYSIEIFNTIEQLYLSDIALPPMYAPSWSNMSIEFTITMVKFVAMSLVYSAIIYRIDNVINERKDTFVQALWLVVKKSPSIILATIFYGVIITIVATLLLWIMPPIFNMLTAGIRMSESTTYGVFFLFMLASIPIATIISLPLSFFGYFIVLENLGVYQAFTASCRLVWGHWWRTFLVFLIFAIPFFVIRLFISEIDSDSFYGGYGEPYLLTLPLIALLIPYFFVLGYLQYHDLKLRKNL